MRSPPAAARALLRLLLADHEVREALEGDLLEGFYERAEGGRRRARLWYWGQVLRMPYLALNREIRRLERAGYPKTRTSGGGWMGGSAMDVRVAARTLWRRPVFAGVSVATLALSIGAATLLFSVVEGVLLTPLPYEEPDRLVTIYLTNEEWRDGPNELLRDSWDSYNVTLRHVEAWRGAEVPLSSVAGYTYRRTALDPGDGSAATATAIMVDRGVFPTLGVQPELGRLPSEEELRRGDAVAVLRHETWMSEFGGDPDVLGRSFRLGPDVYTVIGVMPPGFYFPRESASDLWIPVVDEARAWPTFYGVGRLVPDTDPSEAGAALDRVARRLGEEDPELSHLGARAVPQIESVIGNVRGGIHLLFGATLLVVLVACVNLGNLVLARTSGRIEELAVRSSLGASGRSLVGTVLTEVVIVGSIGGALGIVLAAFLLDPFVAALDASVQGLPRAGSVGLNSAVYGFSLLATMATALAAGLVPAVSVARTAPAGVTGSASRRGGGSRGTRRGQRALLAVQAALTVVLLTGAGLLARSFLEASSVDTGLDVDRLGFFHVTAPEEEYGVPADVRTLRRALLEGVEALPAVASATVTTSLPAHGGSFLLPVRTADSSRDEASPVVGVMIGRDYFRTMGIPLHRGRPPAQEEIQGGNGEIVLSRSLARGLFGDEGALGRHVLVGSGDAPWTMRVVGIADEARHLSVTQPPVPTFYLSMGFATARSFAVVFRADGDPQDLLRAATAAALDIDPDLELGTPSTLAESLRASLQSIRLRMVLMVAMAGLAGMLAVVGIGGVVAHYLSERTWEVGLRMALGARARREVGRVVSHAMIPTGLGLALGVLVALAASGLMESFLFQVEPDDPVTYAVVTAGLAITALIAAWVPARRAARVDPARMLDRE